MFQPNADQLAAALAHAEQCAPLESCGVIAGDEFIAIDNLAAECGHFIMDRRAFCRIDSGQKVTAIVHSHVDYPAIAGETDRASCEATGLPWLIVSWPAGRWCVITPEGWTAPLIGREWAWGSHDCYGLIRDGFAAYTGIQLPDYPRDWMFWKESDEIGAKIAENDFVILPEGSRPQHCDLIGMRFASPVVNHLALFLEPDQILHQLYRRLSVREIYGGIFRERMVFILRHKRLL